MNRTAFEERANRSSPDLCWEWSGRRTNDGYGRYGGRLAHRVSYELFVGPIPEGLEIDHLCRNTWCVNPSHLEPVTGAENMRRRAAARTHCKSGHPYDEANTRVRLTKRGRTRMCRACERRRAAAYQARRRAL